MFISSGYRWAIRSIVGRTLVSYARMPKGLVCIPTYNEAGNILPLVERIGQVAPELDMLVIDDGSPDGTGDLVRERMLKEARLNILARPVKLGLGTAYLAGFAFGL